MATQTSSKAPKIAIALVLIAICGYYAYAQYAKFSTPLRPERAAPAAVASAEGGAAAASPGAAPSAAPAPTDRPGGQEFGPPSPEMRAAMRNQMFATLNLTDEQRAQIEALGEPGQGGNPREHFEKMREILTPEQREQMGAVREQHMAQMMSRRLEEARKTLPESEVQKLEQKMKERQEARRNGERPAWAPDGGRGGRDDAPPPPGP
jgi:Spy/CpxP family protein refolding chaperone